MQCIACLLTATVLYVGECANRNKQRVSEYGCEGFDFDFADGDKIRPWQEPGIEPTPPINMFALNVFIEYSCVGILFCTARTLWQTIAALTYQLVMNSGRLWRNAKTTYLAPNW